MGIRRKRDLWVVLGLLAVAGVGALLNIGGGTDEPPASDSLVACHQAVTADFKNPATVDFHTTEESLTRSGDGWRLTGTLDAKTPLGVEQVFSYTCTTSSAAVVLSHSSVRTG